MIVSAIDRAKRALVGLLKTIEKTTHRSYESSSDFRNLSKSARFGIVDGSVRSNCHARISVAETSDPKNRIGFCSADVPVHVSCRARVCGAETAERKKVVAPHPPIDT